MDIFRATVSKLDTRRYAARLIRQDGGHRLEAGWLRRERKETGSIDGCRFRVDSLQVSRVRVAAEL
jgi:hypothetical protein